MQNRFLSLLNGAVMLITGILLFSHFASPARNTPINTLPGTAAVTLPHRDLVFVVFPDLSESSNPEDAEVTLLAQPLTPDGLIDDTQPPRELFRQPEPPGCMTDSLHPSPNGRFLLIQYNCESTLLVRLLDVTNDTIISNLTLSGYFLGWSPDGEWFLFRGTEADQLLLIAGQSLIDDRRDQIVLNVPSGTYTATFTPDGRHILYAASAGLGFGSDLGSLSLADNRATELAEFPRHIIATPRLSPQGKQLAYVRLPDNNAPFTVAELWLAESDHQDAKLMAEADGGRGYAPVWTPDSQALAFVQRENPDDVFADHLAQALRSNIYRLEVDTGRVTPLTDFQESHVYDPVWSADGLRLAFTADDAVWVLEEGSETPVQVSPPGVAAGHPVWLPDPGK